MSALKKVFLFLGGLLLVALTIGVAVFVLSYTGVINTKPVDLTSVYVYHDDAGRTYTEAEWDWHPIESKKIISYVDTIRTPTTKVVLSFDNYTYYDMVIPDVPYIQDFGKTIWAEDGSFMVRVIGDATMENLSAIAGIDNGENMNQYSLRSKSGVKGSRTIATIIGTTAVVVNVYDGDAAFSIMHDALSNNRTTYSIADVPYAKSCKTLSQLVYTGQFIPSIEVVKASLYQERHLFENGSLWSQSVTKSFDDTSTLYLIKISALSDTRVIEEVYNDGKVLFARSGDYYLGVVKVNANTCTVLVGEGEEAYCNIIANIAEMN